MKVSIDAAESRIRGLDITWKDRVHAHSKACGLATEPAQLGFASDAKDFQVALNGALASAKRHSVRLVREIACSALGTDDVPLPADFFEQEENRATTGQDFLPSDLWREMRQRVGEQGEHYALTALAARFFSAYPRVKRNGPERGSRGGILLPIGAYTETWSSGTEYTYNTRSSIEEGYKALVDVLSRDGIVLTSEAYLEFTTNQRWRYAPHKVISLGPDVQLRLFKDTVKFALSERAAKALNLFLSLWGTPSQEAA